MPLLRVREGTVNPGVSPDRVLLLGVTLIGIASLGFYFIPNLLDPQAPGSKGVNAFYCAVMTLTTIGFGDICPSKEAPWEGKFFLVLVSLSGLGLVCGPLLAVLSNWRHVLPGGWIMVLISTYGMGFAVFRYEGHLSMTDAIYASVITGTTIGYGDVTPKTNTGKVLVAMYALLGVGVTGVVLDVLKEQWMQLCQIPPEPKVSWNQQEEKRTTSSTSTTLTDSVETKQAEKEKKDK